MKEVVKVLLEKAGYLVLPYGTRVRFQALEEDLAKKAQKNHELFGE